MKPSSTQAFVIPAPIDPADSRTRGRGNLERKHLRVMLPGTRRELAPEGELVPLDSYWRRRLRAGDVLRDTEREPRAATTPAPREAATEAPTRRSAK